MRRIGEILRSGAALAACAVLASPALAAEVLAPPKPPGAAVKPFVKVASGLIALTHARLIDGTGAPEQADRIVVIDGGKIASVLPGDAPPPAGATVIDLTGKTVIPGLVGMHDHLFYIARPNLDAGGHADEPILAPQMSFSSPRMYLAAGVTTLRTTGSVEPYADLGLKQQIDAGELPGPHLDVTGPYLEGPGSPFIQMHQLKDPEDARRTVAFWADQGATSFKAYMFITRPLLKAAIEEAHKRGLKVTGHLCAVTYPEAVELGIDDLEHGFYVNTQLDPGKKPDVCPDSEGDPTIDAMTPQTPEGQALIRLLMLYVMNKGFSPDLKLELLRIAQSLRALYPLGLIENAARAETKSPHINPSTHTVHSFRRADLKIAEQAVYNRAPFPKAIPDTRTGALNKTIFPQPAPFSE